MKPLVSILAIVSLSMNVACSNSSPAPTANGKTSLGTAAAGDLTVELLADSRLETGLNPITIKVTGADGKAVTDAKVTLVPLMSMSSKAMHSAPVIGEPTVDTDDLYHGFVVFQMPSSDTDHWSATVGINDSDAATNDANFSTLNVADSGRAQVFSYTDPGTSVVTQYVTSLNFTEPPKIGLNPIVFTLHRMQDTMTYVPVDDATVTLDPQMSLMGHGSSASINPTATSLGRYEGKLSLSMSGTWETTVTVSQAGVTLGAPKFETIF